MHHLLFSYAYIHVDTEKLGGPEPCCMLMTFHVKLLPRQYHTYTKTTYKDNSLWYVSFFKKRKKTH